MTVPKVFVRSAYNYDMMAASVESGLECLDASLAQQHQAEEADINTIVRRFGITGTMPQALVPPTFSDFDDVFDYRSAQDALIAARDSFMAMPFDVRARFGNDPQEFVEFASKPENLEEMRKMGLAPRPPPSEVKKEEEKPKA